MASKLSSELTLTQSQELIARLGRFGLSPEVAKKLMGDDEAMRTFVRDGLKSLNANADLIHGVFNKTSDVLVAFKARCASNDIDFGKFSWIGSETAPEFDPNDPEIVVVLDVTFDTLQSTFEFAWAWTMDGQERNYRWEGVVTNSKKLRLLSDDRKFKPFTLRWVRIKLDTHVGKKPVDVRDPKSSPGCALLFMSAEHPERIKVTDYKKRFGFWLPGLKCTAPDGDAWRRVPSVNFDDDDRRVGLYSDWLDCSYGYLAVPSFRE
ncbi:MAG: hypothetical protein NUW08_00090 [Candidatus Uhrbacteria bacterium]|nr:hypothetical protein [Candidatus Uhrbacteria bacterium]